MKLIYVKLNVQHSTFLMCLFNRTSLWYCATVCKEQIRCFLFLFLFYLFIFLLFCWKSCRKLGRMVFLNVSHWLIKCVIIGVTCTLRLSKLCSLPLIQVQIGIWLHSVEIKWLRLQGSHFTYIYEVCDNSPQQQILARTERFNLDSLSSSPSPLLMLNKISRREIHILYSQDC